MVEPAGANSSIATAGTQLCIYGGDGEVLVICLKHATEDSHISGMPTGLVSSSPPRPDINFPAKLAWM